MSIKLVTGSDNAPVSLVTALRFCRALEQDADMVWLLLQAATAKIEDYTGIALVTKTYAMEFADWAEALATRDLIYPENKFDTVLLRMTPLVSIEAVQYYLNGVLTTWSADNYRADTAHLPGRLVVADGASLPDVDSRPDAIQITFKAGYGTTASQMPAPLRTAVLMLTHYWFDNRVPVADAKGAQEMPMSLRALLRAYRMDSSK